MKIAFVIANMNGGGAERAVSNLSLAMEKLGHDVSLILFDAENITYPFGGKLIDVNIRPASSAVGQLVNLIKRFFKLKKIYKEQNFDGIFTFMEGSGFPSVMATKETIVSVHNNPKSLSKIYLPFYPYIYPKAKKVCACSQAIEDKLVELYGLKNTTTILNSVDLELAKEKSKESISEERPFMLALGRLVSQKGFDYLIEAYSNSRAKESLDLLICGEGEDREKLQAQIDEKGLSDKIILKGNVDNPFAYYSKARLYVLSSRHEGFPNILIEALACGCPCISFDCNTGPNEIIENGKNGLLVEAENVGKLTEAMDNFIDNPELEKEFRQNARDSVSHLSPESIAKEWLKLI